MRRLSITLLSLVPLFAFCQRDWDAIEIKTINITKNIGYLEGSGGNIGVLYGKDGIMIIDDQFAELSTKIKAALIALSDSELKFIANTHYHGDHTGGNENLSVGGIPIIAQENVRTRLSTSWFNGGRDEQFEAKPEGFWPTITFGIDMSFYFNDEKLQIIHVPNAHTDGDALFFFVTSNIIHTGDAFVRYGYPYIDISAGGSIDGMIKAQEKILEIADENTQIIPGHGQISNIKDVKELLAMLKSTRNIIAKLKEEGKSLDDCLSQNPFSEFHERWSGSFVNSDLFVRAIYESLN